MSGFYSPCGKRLLDLAVAVPALIVLSPVIGVVAALVRLKLGRPVLFRQVRPGLKGRPFKLLKFRTMTETRDERGRPLPDEARLTSLGRALRRTSLDELPELLNVIAGHMSLVGPRPLLMEYLDLYSTRQARRHEVPPGLTGWAQVNGRNAVCWEERFRLDVWYVDHLSFGLDIRILYRTLMLVLRGKGVSADDHATMPRFKGPERKEE